MLVLGRNPGEEIYIGDDIVITNLGDRRIKIGIDAPRDCRVLRSELVKEEEAKKDER